MKFILDSTLFKQKNRTNLLSLLYNALRNRAYIEFDIDDSNVSTWLSSNDLEHWTIAYDTYISDAANYPLKNCVYVSDGIINSDWSKATPNITLTDACNLITCPLQIWVENSRNDGDFFRLFLSPPTRKHLDFLIDSGVVKFESRGGIGEMKAVLTQNPTELGYKNKRFIVYDSDAPYPNSLQPDAQVIRDTCNQYGILHHHWLRRSIENYLPVQYLIDKVHVNARDKSSDVKKYNAFLSMTQDQQFHFHMKKGLYDSTCFSSPLFQGSKIDLILSTEELWEGFTGKFANKFIQKVNHKDSDDIRKLMIANDTVNELSSIEQTLLQYIRVPV
ncbi:conserved hypothetical protein [Vibrio crassostreae]|nr:conserved hypothetical protein [Vibrio crassostreae]CAK3597895.1 conserved hypothetical protein [Vibrio crassostreae]CAK3622653.1 conserved hypothetical protein [Vibrio crassostreae]CAK3632618.1 conserved hypothetical protein [Vibrio crassostreae]CAK3682426.1 conserved hypothetical protein [Vibrio crassostreae]